MIGQSISHYEILEKLGEGGMGVVYKAQDTKLDRLVALKFLPEHVSVGSADLERFTQEAKAAAGLNHPNICTIHGIEQSDGKDFIVMEYVEGQTLQERKSSLSIKQALDIGIQIAEGLAAAHEKGIVHRDIKPENIMFRKDGRVQIMDFGLAKLRGASRLTKEGSTVGTAGYMSPEQVQGQETDHRSDIFSLGVLLYEMLTDQPPFKGVHETAIAYEIVNVDSPPMSSLKPDIPAELDAIVLECLEKDPNERAQSAKQIALDLKRYKRESSRQRASRITAARPIASQLPGAEHRPILPIPQFTNRPVVLILGAFAVVMTVIAAFLYFRSPDEKTPSIQALITSPKGTNFHSYGQWAGPVIVSPDGRMVAFVSATREGKTALYLRMLNAGTAIALPGTEGAYYPFWSHDSKWIAFFSVPTGKLKKVDVAGNPPITICDAPNQRGGSWGKNDVIVFSFAAGRMFSVPSSGGTPVQVMQMDTTREESSQRWPCFLPDGRHFLYFSRTISLGAEAEGDAIMVGSIDGGPGRFVVNSSTNAIYASGYLLYMRGGTLLAQQFDESALSVTGDAVAVAEGVINDAGFSLGVFAASDNGILAYQTGEGIAGARMVVVDRQGKELEYLGDVIEHFTMRISPDGRRIVQSIFEPKSRTQNLWMHDFSRGNITRFTSGIDGAMFPVWSPDGQRVAYTRFARGDETNAESFLIPIQPVGGGAAEEILIRSKTFVTPTDWSPDGKAICLGISPLFSRVASSTQSDLWIQAMEGERKMSPFVESPYNETDGRFSPDGRWIAYTSDETGRREIYLRPYPGPGTAIKVSTSGGSSPVWRRDGRELFYISDSNRTMSVEIRPANSSVAIGVVRELFARTPIMAEYDVFPDGRRFLINRVIEPSETEPVTIVVNWMERIRK